MKTHVIFFTILAISLLSGQIYAGNRHTPDESPDKIPTFGSPNSTITMVDHYLYEEGFIKGQLYSNGRLTFHISRSGAVTGRDLFRGMMLHFGPLNIKEIGGVWMDLPGLDANYAKFQKLIRDGLSHEQAAKGTFTGKMATDFLFDQVDIGSICYAEDKPNLLTSAVITPTFRRSPSSQHLAEALFRSSTWLDALYQDMLSLPAQYQLSSDCQSRNNHLNQHQRPPDPPPPPLGGNGMGQLIY